MVGQQINNKRQNKNEIVNALDSLRMKTEGVIDSNTTRESSYSVQNRISVR